jgi:tetratricopeptide (TPR) repeat protein
VAEDADTMFQEALAALRQDDRAGAKDLLTRLIKDDQENATYWVWMSAAVDTLKEQVYCLETALKLDPRNVIARHGLVLMGGLPPDEKVKPFPLNRARSWEDRIFLENEAPPETGLLAILGSPITRLAGLLLAGVVVIGLAVLGIFSQRGSFFLPGTSGEVGSTPTFASVPTFGIAAGAAAGTPSKPTPLAELLGVFYTATPSYVNTPRSPVSADAFRAAQGAFQQGKWDEFQREMALVKKAEPEAPDVPYYIGEGYRAQGSCRTALDYYNDSLKLDAAFAPGYLGLARARLCIEPGADTLGLYDLALNADPNYGEVYLDRAKFNLVRKDFTAALPDLDRAARLMPRSALVQLAYAQAYLLQGNYAKALNAARKANSIDLTLLPSYYYLGRAYSETGQYADAIKPLQIYVIYAPEEAGAFALLGQALTKTEDYRGAIDALNQAVRLDPNEVRPFIYLGISYLRLGNLAGGELNFKRGLEYFPDSFDANIGLTEIYYRKGTYGTAYLQAETAKSKAMNDTQLALAIYWRALCQEGRHSLVDAYNDWKTLLSMPSSAMTPQMRKDARDHLSNIVLPSNTPKHIGPSPTPTLTPTNRPGMTATPAPTTPTPVATESP